MIVEKEIDGLKKDIIAHDKWLDALSEKIITLRIRVDNHEANIETIEDLCDVPHYQNNKISGLEHKVNKIENRMRCLMKLCAFLLFLYGSFWMVELAVRFTGRFL